MAIFRIFETVLMLCKLSLVVGLFLLTGCAANRSVLDIKVEPYANPASNQIVKIVKVTDSRVFEKEPNEPSTPSVKGGEIENKEITSRAVARKRGGYGNAWGDVVLPEGRTAADLMKSAISRAFQEAGYQVVESNDAKFAEAIPVEADMKKFWSWMTPGFWSIALECKTQVEIKMPVASFQDGVSVEGYARDTFQAATEDNWQEIINKGLADFIKNLKSRLSTAK